MDWLMLKRIIIFFTLLNSVAISQNIDSLNKQLMQLEFQKEQYNDSIKKINKPIDALNTKIHRFSIDSDTSKNSFNLLINKEVKIYKMPSLLSPTEVIIPASENFVVHSTFNNDFAKADYLNHSGYIYMKNYSLKKIMPLELLLGFNNYAISIEKETIENKLTLIDNLNKKGIDIIVRSIFPSPPNSADGVDCNIEVEYINNKTIKYVTYEFEAYNAVGDKVRGRIGNEDKLYGKVTGPIMPMVGGKIHYWENVWYNSTIVCIKLIRIDVEYIDGTKKYYLNDIPKLIIGFENDCSYK